ncbi:MAG TPA: hypothetical protein HPP77_01525 [Candidatus Hydrogenedentes bacterium]|nr:hypothetical protein [Candidatus Hydrogenedentota bacterium]HIJ74716.1 hypothetical protein [Candidatus Hydrogenedentota bacterium]
MKLFRILLHGVVLLLANFTGIFAGFMAYNLMKPANQISVQVPVAAALSVLLFVTWSIFVQAFPSKKLVLQGPSEFAWVFLAALVWNPVIFVPVHYVTQGYLTAPGNIVASMAFQLPVNAITLALTCAITRKWVRLAGEGDTPQPCR